MLLSGRYLLGRNAWPSETLHVQTNELLLDLLTPNPPARPCCAHPKLLILRHAYAQSLPFIPRAPVSPQVTTLQEASVAFGSAATSLNDAFFPGSLGSSVGVFETHDGGDTVGTTDR